ncbi:MAG: DNA sulfur modification protein DndD, partial [Eubacteriaceae bacterium]
GMNGRGKTTFLEAILLALYGDNSKAFKESRFRTYGKYLRSYVNKSSLSQKSYIELDFILNEQQGSSEYIVRREWDALTKRTREILSVEKNGQSNSFLTENWSMFIENILPSALSSFYFFDGEKIAELAVDETDIQMKDSIRAMLGINVLDVLKNDIMRSVRRTEKNVQNESVSKEFQQLRDEQSEITDDLKKVKIEILDLTSQLTSQKEKANQLHQQYVLKGGNVFNQRQDLMEKRANIIAEMGLNANALIDIASDELPLLLVSDLVSEIKMTAEDEYNDLIMQQAIGQIESLLQEYGNSHPKEMVENRNFVDFIKDSTIESQFTPLYGLSTQALFQVNALIEDLLEQKKKEALILLEKKKELKSSLADLDSYLSLDINENELALLLSRIKKQENLLAKLQFQISTLEQRQGELISRQTIKESKINRLIETYLADMEQVDDNNRLLKYSNMALGIIEKFSMELQKRKTGTLGKTITDGYKKLANKKNLIDEITVDHETLDLTYLDKRGKEVSKESLSAGEKQLIVIAILWALAVCSSKKLPVIIDTPLSRLDSIHRESLVTNYFPNASDQTIILSTDSEIDHHYYKMMEDYIGDEFTLDYDEDSQSTTILKGYFQSK